MDREWDQQQWKKQVISNMFFHQILTVFRLASLTKLRLKNSISPMIIPSMKITTKILFIFVWMGFQLQHYS